MLRRSGKQCGRHSLWVYSQNCNWGLSLCTVQNGGPLQNARFMDRALKSEHGGPKRPKIFTCRQCWGLLPNLFSGYRKAVKWLGWSRGHFWLTHFEWVGLVLSEWHELTVFAEPKPFPYASDFIVNIKTGDVPLRAHCWYFLYKPKPDPLIFSLAFFFYFFIYFFFIMDIFIWHLNEAQNMIIALRV